MRVAASLLAVMAASLVGAQAVHAQSTDKAQQTTPKTQSSQKATGNQAQARPATPAAAPATKPKLEGVSTMRSTPADSKKAGGCHQGDGSDA